jgi:hypothetical protein
VPYYPAYLFAAGSDPWSINRAARSISGCHGLGRFNGQEPLGLPDAVMRALFRRADDNDMIAPLPIKAGKHYKVATGPLAGLIALIASVAGDECRAFVELLGAQRSVRLKVCDLEGEP